MNENQNQQMNNEQIDHWLQDFAAKTEHEITQIQNGARAIQTKVTPSPLTHQEDTPEMQQLKLNLDIVIKDIAQTGDSSMYNWNHLRSLIVIKTRDILNLMQKNYPYVKQQGMNEGFEDELDVILQFLCGFDTK